MKKIVNLYANAWCQYNNARPGKFYHISKLSQDLINYYLIFARSLFQQIEQFLNRIRTRTTYRLKPTIYDSSALLANASLAWSLTCFKIMISIENVHCSLKAEVSEEILKWHSRSLSLSAELSIIFLWLACLSRLSQ